MITDMIARFLSTPVHVAIAGIFALLIFASIVSAILRRAAPGEAASELTRRVNSWWVMIAIFTFAILTTRVVSTVFLGLMTFLALKEYLSLVPTRRVDRSVLLWIYLAIPLQFYFAHIEDFGFFMVWIPVWMFLFIPAR
ncbi:MAG TPA: phosphatidate cytidylyltransferase, partial [Rhizomicrobium sp.]|nr:phosphatidate cytidylyltransferase [Rhizomicrobium sp.]